MTVPIVLAIAGVVTFLIGVLGGGVKAKEIVIPSVAPSIRIILSVAGLALIGVAIWLSLPSTTDNSPTATELPATATMLDIPTSAFTSSTFLPESPLLTITPTMELAYRTVSIDNEANAPSNFTSPPLGNVTFDGIPFSLSNQIFKSQAATSPYDINFTSLIIAVQIPRAHRLYLLLDAGNGFKEFEGKTIGQLWVNCNNAPINAPILVSNLVLGREIREWQIINELLVTTVSYPNSSQVWIGEFSGSGNQNIMGHIDMVAFDLPQSCQDSVLSQIKIDDTSATTVNSLDPAINVTGITVEYYK